MVIFVDMRFLGKCLLLCCALWVVGAAMAAGDPPKKPVRDPYEMSQYVRFSDTTEFQIDSFFRRMYRWGIFNGTYLFHKNDSLCFGAMGYATFSHPKPRLGLLWPNFSPKPRAPIAWAM